MAEIDYFDINFLYLIMIIKLKKKLIIYLFI